ncbi:MAG: ABC transporter permease, partial [Rothia sp. (in: high G+C Gram-positive bacteria)]|nr:ABC transporter permease [Rothia sp. (in: high G+C Gram-positive bacteria)]
MTTTLSAPKPPSQKPASEREKTQVLVPGLRVVRQQVPFLLGVAGSLFAVLLWWIFTHAASGNTMITAFQPENIPGALASLLSRGVLLTDIGISLSRLLAGLAIATLIGIPLGLVIGFSRTFDCFTAPLVQFVRMVSPLSWAPIAVALFGVGNLPVIFLVAIAAIWPITLGTVSGVKALEPVHLQVA